MDKTNIKNILIFSADRWGLDSDTIPTNSKTPAVWWTVSDSAFQSMADGSVKESLMPCSLLFQVGEADNQRRTCKSITIETAEDGAITGATVVVESSVKIRGKARTHTYDFTTGESFTYPFNMKDADSIVTTMSDPNDMQALIDGVVTQPKDSGSFGIGAMVVDEDDVTSIAEALTALNSGDIPAAMTVATDQMASLAAEGYSAEESSPEYDPTSEDPTTAPATPTGYEPAEMAAEDANVMDTVTEPGTTAGVQGTGSGSPTDVGEGHGVTESFGKSTAPVPGTLLSAEGDLEQATVADEMTVETLPGGSEDALGGGPGMSPLEVEAGPSDYVVEDLDARIEAWMAESATHDPYSDEVPYEGPGDFSGSEVQFDAEARKPISDKIKRPGALTRKAKRAGMSVAAFAKQVMANPSDYTKLTRQQAQFYHNVLAKGARTNAKKADLRRKGYILDAESQVTWEDDSGLSSPSSPPSDVFMGETEGVDEIYGTGHIVGQTGSTWTTSPLMAETFCASCGEYDAECGCYAADEIDLPLVGPTHTRSAVVGAGIGIGLLALLARFRK